MYSYDDRIRAVKLYIERHTQLIELSVHGAERST